MWDCRIRADGCSRVAEVKAGYEMLEASAGEIEKSCQRLWNDRLFSFGPERAWRCWISGDRLPSVVCRESRPGLRRRSLLAEVVASN